MLKIVYPICCGLDVHKDFVYACIASTVNGVTTYKSYRFSTFTKGLRELLSWLLANNCKDVCMESSICPWIPIATVIGKPMSAQTQVASIGRKAFTFVRSNALLICGNDTGNEKILVNIHPAADRINDFEHNTSPQNKYLRKTGRDWMLTERLK